MVFTILPRKGIQWDQNTILLGEKKHDVEAKLGAPQTVFDHSYYYFESNIRFDFSPNGELEFIEFLGGITGTIQPDIFEVQAFQVDADTLYHVLEEKNAGEIVDTENGYSYAFPNIGIGVYREQIPDNLPAYIREAQEAGEDITDNPNIREEQLKACVPVKKSRHKKYSFLDCFFKSGHRPHFGGFYFFKSGHIRHFSVGFFFMSRQVFRLCLFTPFLDELWHL